MRYLSIQKNFWTGWRYGFWCFFRWIIHDCIRRQLFRSLRGKQHRANWTSNARCGEHVGCSVPWRSIKNKFVQLPNRSENAWSSQETANQSNIQHWAISQIKRPLISIWATLWTTICWTLYPVPQSTTPLCQTAIAMSFSRAKKLRLMCTGWLNRNWQNNQHTRSSQPPHKCSSQICQKIYMYINTKKARSIRF